MIEKVEIKNKTNWTLSFIGSIALIVMLFLIFILIPLATIQKTYFLSIIFYILGVAPFVMIFILILYLWLWNTFGKTILNIEPEIITVIKKNKLFSKPKFYKKNEIEKVIVKDYSIEQTKYFTRFNVSFSGAINSIVFVKNGQELRIIDWQKRSTANEIVDKINKIWK